MSSQNQSIELKQKLNFKFLLNPALFPYTQINGVREAKNLSDYKKITEAFLNELPKYDALILRLHPSFKNPLPFIWSGFDVITRFTFRINFEENTAPETKFKESLKRQIKAAAKTLTIKEVNNTKNLFKLKYLDHQKRKVPLDFNQDLLEDYHIRTLNGIKTVVLEAHEDNKCVGALLYSIIKKEAIYQVGAVHPEHRKSKALTLLLAEAIKQTQNTERIFDFEGSMEPGIARFFSTFGAECVPYYQIEHYPNALAKAAIKAKKFLG